MASRRPWAAARQPAGRPGRPGRRGHRPPPVVEPRQAAGARPVRLLAADRCRPDFGPFLGHHGRPIATGGRLNDDQLFGRDNRCVLEAGAAFATLVRELLGIGATLPQVDALEVASWPLAGLAALADWIGSRQEWFRYAGTHVEPDHCWRRQALPRAGDAVDQAGMEPAPLDPTIVTISSSPAPSSRRTTWSSRHSPGRDARP